MSRFGDKGPYAKWNVRICSVSENHKEIKLNPETIKKCLQAGLSTRFPAKRCKIFQPCSNSSNSYVYNSIAEAARQHNLNCRQLRKVARGEISYYRGWKVEYLRKHLSGSNFI